jgi:hypothetical protein
MTRYKNGACACIAVVILLGISGALCVAAEAKAKGADCECDAWWHPDVPHPSHVPAASRVIALPVLSAAPRLDLISQPTSGRRS